MIPDPRRDLQANSAFSLCHPAGTCFSYNILMPRYDWRLVQKYYDDGHSFDECRLRFGFAVAAWGNAARRGVLRLRARRLVERLHALRSRYYVRNSLLRERLLRDEFYICGLTHWFDEKLSLHLDHINGLRKDNRLENLRMLCPNCHAQTETFSGRNVRRNG